MPLIHSTCQESLKVLAGCVGNNRRCVHWLRRVRSVLTNLFLLLRLLRRVTSLYRIVIVSQVSLLSYIMLICAHTLFLTLL